MAAILRGLFLNLLLATSVVSLSVKHHEGRIPARSPSRALSNETISNSLFLELEQLARIVDISYCVGTAGLGIAKPFSCASRCGDEDFKDFELVTSWNTGPFLSDSCGYMVLSHPPSPPRIILAFRGTYSIANTVADLSTIPQEYVPYPGADDGDGHNATVLATTAPSKPPKCENCTVHTGFYTSWLNTRPAIISFLNNAISSYPTYKLVLVGHSLGGAVATLAALDFQARGWTPYVTTFGEPRIGNLALASYIDKQFGLPSKTNVTRMLRVTHAADPVPLLPLSEWGYSMHGQELYASSPSLPFLQDEIRRCDGDEDADCIAGGGHGDDDSWWGVLPTIPNRFRLWELLFAHRDYFWRLGLCVPGGDPGHWYAGDRAQEAVSIQKADERVNEVMEL